MSKILLPVTTIKIGQCVLLKCRSRMILRQMFHLAPVLSRCPQNGILSCRDNLAADHFKTQHLTISARGYAKPVKGGAGGKDREQKKSIKKMVQELDDDDDDDDDDDVRKRLGAQAADPDQMLGNTPAAKFIQNIAKEVKMKDKAKAKVKTKGGHHFMVNYHEAKALINVDQFWGELEALLEKQREFFAYHLTIRSSSALDDLPVELEGDTYPLREIAEISKKDPKRLIIDTSSFPQATANIMKALTSSSGLNLNPQQDGTRIYVPLPKVTREHREKLCKGAREKSNETKNEMRKIQNKKVAQLSEVETAGKVHAPKDNFLATHEILIGMTEHFFALVDAMTVKKQKDLMETS